MLALELIAWLLAAYVVTSAFEYFPHRWVMHSRQLARRVGSARLAEEFESHATLHHGRFFGPRSFTTCADPAARYVSIDTGALYMLGKTWWVWLPLAAVSLIGAGVLAAFFAAHGALWTAVHREMHYPSGRWFARSSAYRFWHRYHETHHDRHGTNFNVLCPGFDHLFGTYGGLA
ncbi:MAG TPA: hypothetical protein VF761_17235 [Gemmatimonadaceae bacterium]